MKITCPECDSTIDADDVNLSTMVAKCRACNDVFSIADLVPHAPAVSVPVYEPIPTRPAHLREDDEGFERVISWRWFNIGHIFMAFFCVAWDAFLVFWYSMAFSGKTPWIMVVFPIAHVAVGIGLTYATLCGFLNRTKIRFGGDAVTVHSGPIPSLGNVSIPAGDIVQLYCELDVRKPSMFNARAMNTQSRNMPVPQYQVSCVGHDGSTRRLVGGLATLSEAKYIERTIEDCLRIKPAPVAGEVTG